MEISKISDGTKTFIAMTDKKTSTYDESSLKQLLKHKDRIFSELKRDVDNLLKDREVAEYLQLSRTIIENGLIVDDPISLDSYLKTSKPSLELLKLIQRARFLVEQSAKVRLFRALVQYQIVISEEKNNIHKALCSYCDYKNDNQPTSGRMK